MEQPQAHLLKLLDFITTGLVQFNTYGVGTHTGVATYDLSVDAAGTIIETTGGGAGGPFVPYMSGADQIARTELRSYIQYKFRMPSYYKTPSCRWCK